MIDLLRAGAKVMSVSVLVIVVQLAVAVMIQPYSTRPLAGIAHAEEGRKKDKEMPRTRVTQALSNNVYKKVQEAQKAAEDKDSKKALEILNDLKKSKRLNDYELATILNIEGYIYFGQENYPKAQATYEKILTLKEIPEATSLQARYSLAQAYFISEDYANGVAALKGWFKEAKEPGASAYVLMAQGLNQLKDYKGALKNIEIAIKMYKDKGKVPRENWFAMQSYLYYQKGNYKKVASILKELLTYYPSKKYWIQLSGMYSELKDDKDQLAAMETAYVQGMLTSQEELVNMASLFLANDVPYKAAKVLDKAIKEKKVKPTSKNLELLGVAWRQAQEIKRAIPEMAKAAAKSDKGELWAQLCGVYLDNDNYQKALDACNKGIGKGGVKRLDMTYLYKGMALFNLKKYDAARKAFHKAGEDKRTKPYAKQWIKYMDADLKRQKSLEKG